MNFGERLTELRKSKGYTREAFAEYLGISKYTLRNYELSVNEPGSSFLRQISDIFDVSIDYLMGLTNEKERILPYNLKSSEYEHIKKYRDLDDHGKDMVDTVLDKEYTRCKLVQTAVIDFEEFKEKQEERLEEYSNLLKAAHERTDIEPTEEMKQNDNDIMNDPEF